MKKLTTTMLITGMLSVGAYANSERHGLTAEQRAELYKKGTITVFDEDGSKRGHFEVKFMPGAENVIDDAKQRWKDAADIMDDLVDRKEFWEKEIVDTFKEGMEYAKEGIREGIFKIPEDFKDTLEENKETEDSFGSLAYKIKNWFTFGATVAGRVLATVWGVGAGSVYALVTPVGNFVYRPVAAGTTAILAGTLWPVVAYTWNGTAWVVTSGSNEPKAGDMTVTFVPERLEQHDEDQADNADDDQTETEFTEDETETEMTEENWNDAA